MKPLEIGTNTKALFKAILKAQPEKALNTQSEKTLNTLSENPTPLSAEERQKIADEVDNRILKKCLRIFGDTTEEHLNQVHFYRVTGIPKGGRQSTAYRQYVLTFDDFANREVSKAYLEHTFSPRLFQEFPQHPEFEITIETTDKEDYINGVIKMKAQGR